MKVVVLTTPTTHHLYYVWKLNAAFPLAGIVLETEPAIPPFETFHPYETDRDGYEREVLLSGAPDSYADIVETHQARRAGDSDAMQWLRHRDPDVVIVFGTRRIPDHLISAARSACLNLHGGNPEQYRGLDTHLWAIYHGDFDNVVTTLHKVDGDLDTGDIVMQTRVDLQRCRGLHMLRAVNTEACLQLSRMALESIRSGGPLPSRAQVARGRYYSFMPAALKAVCVRKLERHLTTLA